MILKQVLGLGSVIIHLVQGADPPCPHEAPFLKELQEVLQNCALDPEQWDEMPALITTAVVPAAEKAYSALLERLLLGGQMSSLEDTEASAQILEAIVNRHRDEIPRICDRRLGEVLKGGIRAWHALNELEHIAHAIRRLRELPTIMHYMDKEQATQLHACIVAKQALFYNIRFFTSIKGRPPLALVTVSFDAQNESGLLLQVINEQFGLLQKNLRLFIGSFKNLYKSFVNIDNRQVFEYLYTVLLEGWEVVPDVKHLPLIVDMNHRSPTVMDYLMDGLRKPIMLYASGLIEKAQIPDGGEGGAMRIKKSKARQLLDHFRSMVNPPATNPPKKAKAGAGASNAKYSPRWLCDQVERHHLTFEESLAWVLPLREQLAREPEAYRSDLASIILRYNCWHYAIQTARNDPKLAYRVTRMTVMGLHLEILATLVRRTLGPSQLRDLRLPQFLDTENAGELEKQWAEKFVTELP